MKFVAYDPQVKSRQPVCLICKAYGWTVRLNFNREHGFWWCPDCGGEWWPGLESGKPEKVDKPMEVENDND